MRKISALKAIATLFLALTFGCSTASPPQSASPSPESYPTPSGSTREAVSTSTPTPAATAIGETTTAQTRRDRIATTVLSVGDGDTLRVQHGTARIRVRLSCVDAPEVPHTKKERASSDPANLNQFKWGSLSRDRLTQLIHQGGDRVALNIVDTDRYGRQVAEVRLPDGTLIQKVLLREGLAMVYRKYINNCPSAAILEQAETHAKQQQLNIWGDSQFTAPWEWRHSRKS